MFWAQKDKRGDFVVMQLEKMAEKYFQELQIIKKKKKKTAT